MDPRSRRRTSVVLDARVEWDLDEIVRGGDRWKIEPRHMRVFACLVARAGAVVSRQDLLSDAWPDVIVEDEALTQSISVLRRAFGDHARAPRVIQTVPKKGYRLVAPVEAPAPDAPPAAPERRRARTGGRLPPRLAAALAAACPVAVLLWAHAAPPAGAPAGPLEAVAATSYPGREAEPALSPEGRPLAFVWNGPERGAFDLWVKELGSETPRRLTETPELETGAAFAPDGRSIAFARVGYGTCELVAISLADGAERRLAGCGAHAYPQLAFSPDGRILAVSDSDAPSGLYRIALLSLATGAARPLSGPVQGLGDRYPAFSPDGRLLAFVRGVGMGASDLHVVAVAGGEPRRLTGDGAWQGGVTWSPGGRELIASSSRRGEPGLWRVPLDGGAPRWLGVREAGAVRPGYQPAAGALVFERQAFDSDVWATTPGGPAAPRALLASTRSDGAPRFSPDGRLLAFVSDRSGAPELWVARADGGSPRRLSDLGAARMLPPSWTPDGRALVVAADRDGQGDLFLVPLAGAGPTGRGRARRIAQSAAHEIAPAVAADGRSVFFMSDRGGRWRLWRVGLDGDRPRPVVDLPLSAVVPAGDGTSLFASRFDRAGLWRVPLGGGAPELLVPELAAGDWANWAARGDVLDYVDRTGGGARLARLDLRTGALSALGPLPLSEDDQGLAVSPDGRTVLYTRRDRAESDVFLVSSLR